MAVGHRDRVRKRFQTDDINELPEVTILEAYLHSIVRRKDTRALADRLLEEFGSFAQIVDAPIESLMEVKGVGETVASQIKMLPAYMRLYMRGKLMCHEIISNEDEAGEVLTPYFIGETNEVVYAMYLNNMGKLLGCDRLAEGSENAVALTVRKVLAGALKYHATGVILAHNHPGGNALPSAADIELTKKLQDVLFESNLTLVDHLIFDDVDFIALRTCIEHGIWSSGLDYLGNGAR
ncbi:MAG: DNA repair protein RadC [Ruminococcaceae bacterium]|nr:DNA repair protein RadC [Oscillospiraceae bacterium]